MFSTVAVPIYIPTSSVGGFPFLHTLSSIHCLFDDSHPDLSEVIFHCLICIFLIIGDVEHLSVCLLAICVSSTKKIYSRGRDLPLTLGTMARRQCNAISFPFLSLQPTARSVLFVSMM